MQRIVSRVGIAKISMLWLYLGLIADLRHMRRNGLRTSEPEHFVQSLISWGCSLALCMLLAGCSVDSESLDKLSKLATTISSEGSFQTDTSFSRDNSAKESESERFVPPYPDRRDPFRFPDQSVDAPTTVVTNAASVTVLGFAQVGTELVEATDENLQVLLKSGDQTFRLRLGESFLGIKVTEIKPPEISLQSGDLNWTVSMFDRRD